MNQTTPAEQRIGLLAGWGRFPVLVAQALRRAGYRTYCLGFVGHADPRLAELCDEFQWIGLARLGRAIRYFRRRGVRQATMAGKIHKVLLFKPGILWRHLPDWRTLRTFFPHFVLRSRNKNDDTLLGTIVEMFAQDGIHMAPATDFAPRLLVRRGCLTRQRPSWAQRKDIQFGWRLAKAMGGLDVGQSVAVKACATLAVEAIEGTDECILRAGQLCPSGGFTVVKVAKPQQDMRFDVPTIGRGTIETLIRAGGKVLALEAGKTIVLDEAEVVALADRHRIAVAAFDEAEIESLADAAPRATA